MSSSYSFNPSESVAIIGMAGRFPGAKNLDEFWHNLRDGVESISFFSEQELEAAGVTSAVMAKSNYVKARGVLEGVELFDAAFFGYFPSEAEIMDPQQRLFLECSWTALEDAGYDPETYKGQIGVYAGSRVNTYLLNNLYSHGGRFTDGSQTLMALEQDYLTTRVSYKLNLRGPSLRIQTACSTSLVAVHVACQALLNGECDMALAGGVSINVPQKSGYQYQEGDIVSPDGHCRAFDAKAQGTVFGSGVGIVVLKRQVDALANGDNIYAVIKGSAIGNDGALKIGYTAPSATAQAQVIAEALEIAGVDPETVNYVEAHGTGTQLGDPIEIAGLTQAYRARTQKKGFCAVGSLKPNIGHLSTAAGVAGLIKTILAMKHKLLPPNLHFEQPNPKIDFENSPFYVNARLREWNANGAPRRAGVSAFGVGGTNAHLVIEEASPMAPAGPSRSWQLLSLSAKTNTALQAATGNLAEYLKQTPNANIADVAYTLKVGRRGFDHRRIVVCKDREDAVGALETLDSKKVFTSVRESEDRTVVFMFPGQGSQYVNMALGLYQEEPAFRNKIDGCFEILKSYLGFDLGDVLYPSGDRVEKAADELTQTAMSQPALFVVEYALATLLSDWGIEPQAMIGHSIGEYVAACIAGVFSLEDALRIVAARGQLMNRVSVGSMLAVPLPEEELEPFLSEKLSLAAVNGPSLCVVSGSKEAVAQLEDQLTGKGLEVRHLYTSHAFHSQMMEPILQPFSEEVGKVKLNPPKRPYLSNITGTWITAAEATDPNYWARHIRQTVRFAEGLEKLLNKPQRVFVEVGPGQTLSSLAKLHPDNCRKQIFLSSVRHPQERHSDTAFLLRALGRLFLSGIQVDWPRFYAEERRHRLHLPTYPFERQRYWVETKAKLHDDGMQQVVLDKKPNIAEWFYIPSWKRSIAPQILKRDGLADQQFPWLVFMDEGGLGAQIEQHLRQQGQGIISVKIGEKFNRVSETLFTINPQAREDYDVLIKELQMLGKVPKKIVHLWNVTATDRTQSENESFERSQYLGFYSLLFLAQTLGKQEVANPLQIEVVSNGMQEVHGEAVMFPEKATVLGPCRVIPREYTNISCRSIDIALPQLSNGTNDNLIEQLVAELNSKSMDLVVAYRGKHRWVQTFEPVRLESKEEFPTRLRKSGVYLITGGLGGIGLVLAEYLAKTVQAKLVLTGRSRLPARDKWGEWLLTHEDQENVSGKIRKVQALEELGAEVLVASADVANLEQMQEVINWTHERFGQIHGVIHAAGVAGGGMIQLKTPEMAADVLGPKVKGTRVLEKVLEKVSLDFLVLCSSMLSITGGLGQVDYSAANAFLDAFAHNSSVGSNFTASINWGAWQEVGMAVDINVPSELDKWKQENLKTGILPEEGKAAFGRILDSTLPQVLVSTRDLQRRIDELNYYLTGSGESKVSDNTPSCKTTHARPKLSKDYVAARNGIEKTIAEIWQEVFGLDQIGIHDNFFDLGGHSLAAVRLVSQVNRHFGSKLRLQSVFQSPTIAEMATLITENLSKQPGKQDPSRILSKLELLSDEDAKALLAGHGKLASVEEQE
jgi:acyl transferase domain-containing protein/acyl carrier protein